MFLIDEQIYVCIDNEKYNETFENLENKWKFNSGDRIDVYINKIETKPFIFNKKLNYYNYKLIEVTDNYVGWLYDSESVDKKHFILDSESILFLLDDINEFSYKEILIKDLKIGNKIHSQDYYSVVTNIIDLDLINKGEVNKKYDYCYNLNPITNDTILLPSGIYLKCLPQVICS